MSNLPNENSPSKANPFSSPLLVNRLLTEGSGKETRHFEFCLKDSGMEYLPGDSLGVLPTNCSEVVADLLNAVGLTGEELVEAGDRSMSLSDALSGYFACTVLSKMQIKKFNQIAQSDQLGELLEVANKEALMEFMWGRELIDLFLEFPQSGMDAETFISFLRPMAPRLYSIASSLSAHPDEVHLTVAVVRYEGYGRKCKGVCSSYLAERVGESIPCYLHPNKNFKLLRMVTFRSLWLDRELESLPSGRSSRKERSMGLVAGIGYSSGTVARAPIICTGRNSMRTKGMGC